ncbi:reverse transcriptase domain-containing protein [Nephila pilipes]|uniref:Reverse transcriptase domain-containing protein n=1 Tax=Nephila pilipes TaxID=299642 RepID=A0A8X6MUV0_NEPPI|nr:reverse transcriptase domain-containing protein [Nephila pilipes]
MFGVNVSPFLLSATIKHHIEKYREQYPAATELLDTCLYVDDVISGADDISQALKISKDADTIMKDASMKLRKWNSNDQALMKTWEYEGLETHPRHSENDSGVQSSKVLGIPWNVIHDYFTIDVKGLLELDTSKPVTKRIVLQSAGKIYDPVGFLSPYTIKLKCLLQELWLRKLAWDDELPPDIYATWLQWQSELPLLFIHNCRTRSAKIKGPLTSQEVSYAENWLIRSLHEKEFPEEMRKLLAAKITFVKINFKLLLYKMASRNVYCNLSDKDDLTKFQKLMFDDSEVENIGSEELETQVQDEGKEGSETDSSENIRSDIRLR